MSKSARTKEYIVPINLSLSEDIRNKIAAACGSEDIAAALPPLISEFLTHYVDGGFVITSRDIERMSDAAEEPVLNSAKIIELVDKASGKKAGAHSFNVQVDPNMIPSIQDSAISRSMELGDVIQEAWDSLVLSGWLFAVPDKCTQFTLSDYQRDEIGKVLGKDRFYGNDIANAILGKKG